MKPTLKASLLKLALVGALFYTSYGLSNHYAASLAYVPEIAFAWERNIPFWAWTIVPYWSLNLMYAAAFFLCRDTCEQNRYVARLVSAQIVATTCFMLFPLHFGWPKPPTDGLWDEERTDEQQMGASYPELEWAMAQHEAGRAREEFAGRQQQGFDIYTRLNRAAQHKIQPIPVCRIPAELLD